MKKILSVLALAGLVLIVGCSKDPALSPANPALDALMLATDAETKQQVYSEMDPKEKYELWKQHFQIWLDSTAIKNDVEKLNLIGELLNALNPEVFRDESVTQSVFLNYAVPQWMDQAKQVFTGEEIFELTMVNYVSPIQANLYSEEEYPGCFCHVGNNGYSCKKWSYGFPSGVSVTYGICESGPKCDYSRRGCGFLWLSSCNGSHCNF